MKGLLQNRVVVAVTLLLLIAGTFNVGNLQDELSITLNQFNLQAIHFLLKI